MPEKEEKKGSVEETAAAGSTEAQTEDPCAHISDPLRKGLCRVCQVPVIGDAPFCKAHEPPVP